MDARLNAAVQTLWSPSWSKLRAPNKWERAWTSEINYWSRVKYCTEQEAIERHVLRPTRFCHPYGWVELVLEPQRELENAGVMRPFSRTAWMHRPGRS